jgi:AraC family transcriptional regulator
LPPGAWSTPLLDERLPQVGRLAEALARELSAPGPMSEMALDATARLLLVEVARRRGARESAPALSPRTLARIDEFVMAHLAERLLVRDLATVAGLSPTHFAHAFTRVTGRPPHRHVLALRVQRALQMLTTTRRPLVDVAAECGFASQQHMTQVLRAHCGITPGRLRAERSL